MDVSRETWSDVDFLQQLILREALKSGIVVSDSVACGLAAHLSAVGRQNQTLNLTSIIEPEDAVRLHVVDSLMAIPFIPEGSLTLCDLGSGAGFPGIPVALATGKKTVLLEATRKKARFLSDFVAGYGSGYIEVVPQRAEEYALTRAASFDVAIVRAVAQLASLVELAAPLLKPDGVLVAMKGTPDPEEISRGARAALQCGMAPLDERSYTLSGGEARTVLRFCRVSEPLRSLPRRPGMAQKNPLG